MNRVVKGILIALISISCLVTWGIGATLAMGLHVYSDTGGSLPWALLAVTAITVGAAMKTLFHLIVGE